MARQTNPCTVLLAVVLLAPVGVKGEGALLPENLKEWASASIHGVYSEDYKEAEQYAKRIAREYPEHPAGYFFLAAVIDARMERYQNDREEETFYKYCDEAINRGERLLEKRPDDVWVKFFVAGANGAKGTYESRFERWITAFRHGWQGVALLREIVEVDPQMKDPLYGIGLYDYWRSAMTKVLWWMPGVEDKREDGIRMILEAREVGVFVREAASAKVLPVLCDSKDYFRALSIADEMLQRYPDCLAFHWGRAEALLGLERYAPAESTCTYILSRVEKDAPRSVYNSTLARLYLAQVYAGLGKYARALDLCTQIESYTVSEADRKRIGKLLSEADRVKRKARRGR